ncbi:MAG: hypothetical protein ACRBCK_12070 [Alphaproteobacteria bacterium]
MIIETDYTHNGNPDYPTIRIYGDTYRWHRAERYTYEILNTDSMVYLHSNDKFTCGGEAVAAALAVLGGVMCTDTSSGTTYYSNGDELNLFSPT